MIYYILFFLSSYMFIMFSTFCPLWNAIDLLPAAPDVLYSDAIHLVMQDVGLDDSETTI